MNYKTRHPAWTVGYVTVFVCLVIIAILAVTGIVPVDLQPPLMMTLLITSIIGGTIGLVGFFKSYNREAYPFIIVVLSIPLITLIILFSTP